MKRCDKRAISPIIGYVMLVLAAVIVGVLVYQWMKTYVPTETFECPDGVSMLLEDYNYSSESNTLSVTLKNNGRFSIGGYFIHGTTDLEQEIATQDLSIYSKNPKGTGGMVLFPGEGNDLNKFEIDEIQKHEFVFSNSGSVFPTIYYIEITPIRYQTYENKLRVVSCGNAKIMELVNQ